MKPETMNRPALPWWRVRTVWLVIAGPAAVVAAGAVTTVLAVRGADAVVQTRTASAGAKAPALLARNHVAAQAKP